MTSRPGRSLPHFAFTVLALVLVQGGLAWSASPVRGDPQPDSGSLKPGLSVLYYYAKYNHIRELETWMKYKDGKPGEPIALLDAKAGTGKVLTSGSADLVGAHIKGFLRFDEAGTHRFQVTSNDGIRVVLGGEKIYEDPDVHPDRTSDPIPVEIAQPGYYPIEILYFEKKNTATIQLYWSPPGSSQFAPVPASAFWH